MTPEKDPWSRERDDDEPGGRGSGPGLWLWVALVAGIAGFVWLLLSAFPERQADSGDWAQLVKLAAILAVCASGVLFVRRIPLGETLRNIVIWIGIGGLLLIGYAFRDEFSGLGNRLAGELLPSQAIEVADGVVEVRAGIDGHFTVTGEVNGTAVNFLVDTGATEIVLSPADAARAGYDPGQLSFTQLYSTANGTGRGAPVRLDSIAIGPIVLDRVPASVNEAPMSTSLLGMTFLRQLDSYEVRGDLLILRY